MKGVVKFFSQFFRGNMSPVALGAVHEMQQAAGEGIEILPSSFQGLPDGLVRKYRLGRAGLFQKKKAGCGPLSQSPDQHAPFISCPIYQQAEAIGCKGTIPVGHGGGVRDDGARETVGPLRKKHIASQGFRIVRICGFHLIGGGKFLYLIRKKVIFGNVQSLPCGRVVRIALEKTLQKLFRRDRKQ